MLPRVVLDLPREVMPTLGGAEDAEIVLPLPLAAERGDRSANREDYNIVGEAEAGRDGGAGASGDGRAHRAAAARASRFYPPNGGLTFRIVPLQEQVVGGVRRSSSC